MIHEGVPDDEWQEVHAGWLNVLFHLKAWIVHGVDLRNHDRGQNVYTEAGLIDTGPIQSIPVTFGILF